MRMCESYVCGGKLLEEETLSDIEKLHHESSNSYRPSICGVLQQCCISRIPRKVSTSGEK